ncbi:MAG: hypothetical protein WCT08_00845 [Patescibacteria group bacterium]|jgi:hypothetical protein
MPLAQKSIEELKAIYEDEFGHKLSDKEAWEIANRLTNLFKTLMKSDADID